MPMPSDAHHDPDTDEHKAASEPIFTNDANGAPPFITDIVAETPPAIEDLPALPLEKHAVVSTAEQVAQAPIPATPTPSSSESEQTPSEPVPSETPTTDELPEGNPSALEPETPTTPIVPDEQEQLAPEDHAPEEPPDHNDSSQTFEDPHTCWSPPITDSKDEMVAQTLSRVRQRHHLTRYRYARRALRQRRTPWQLQTGSLILLLSFLLTSSVPLLISVSYGLRVYQTYETVRTNAYAGIDHLLDLKQLFMPAEHGTTKTTSKTTSGLLDMSKLARAQSDLSSAHNEFLQVQTVLSHTRLVPLVTDVMPQYRALATTASAATQIGIDATTVGQRLVAAGQVVAPRLKGPLLSDASSPLLLPSDLSLIQTTLDQIRPQLNDIETQSHNLSLSTLPISKKQQLQAQQYLTLLPQIVTTVYANRNLINLAGWLLGVDQPRSFLVQTMDSAELRATGGFTGQYGELQINGGRVAPFSLTNIALLEYAPNSPTYGNLAPAAYQSWWPFANWGLRDSNLSADFPTSAQLAIDRYKAEVNHQVDGVITFTSTTIEHVLQVTGPISIPLYHETITAQNLDAKLHYYQLDNAGIAKEESITHTDQLEVARKQFTSTLAHTLIDYFRQASPGVLLAVGRRMLQDLHTRDLQVYFTNPQVEALLMQYNDAGQMDRSTSHDGLYIVQMNVGVNKASQYVKNTFHDTITLDTLGGATHTLQIHLVYNQTGPVYGQDTYYDYVRIYVPPSAHFLSGDGFHQYNDTPTCTTPLGEVGPADTALPPTNMQSDEPQRAMFGGYVIIPKDCSATINVSWYVPPASSNQIDYALLFQRQAGTNPDLQLTLVPPAGQCPTADGEPLSFRRTLTQDVSFNFTSSETAQHTCSLEVH